jgi:hypothetical protein
MNIILPLLEEPSKMPAFVRDTAALVSIVAFVATVGVWSELIRSIV